MNILFGSLFFGAIFYLLMDVAFFAAVINGYLKYYGIKEYFNPIFIENQNWIAFGIGSIMLGYLMMYCRIARFFQFIYIITFFTVLFLQEGIGRNLGEWMFLKEGVQIASKYTHDRAYDIVFENKSRIYYKEQESELVLVLDKKDLE